MFIDASAIVAILLAEADADALIRRIEETRGMRYVSPLVRFEAALAIARAKTPADGAAPVARATLIDEGCALVDAFIEAIDARMIDISAMIGTGAVEAAKTYGKAAGHAADLNFGDCFSYACARQQKVGLLYKGDDFARTDLG